MVAEDKLTPPLIVILGETASGKSALAIELAKKFDGEIIAADSRTIYKGMDIGTAKPSLVDQKKVPHHLIDVTTPDKPLNVSDFKKLALSAIKDISDRGRLPFLVGGSGLYIDSVIFDFEFRKPGDNKQRDYLNRLSVTELQGELIKLGIDMPSNDTNPRHLIRSIETNGASSIKHPLRDNTLIIGLKVDRTILENRIRERITQMLKDGLIKEVENLAFKYDFQTLAFQTPGYTVMRDYINGDLSLDDAKERFARSDMQLAKRQRTWFKRNKSVHWVNQQGQIVDLVTTFLNN
jgi:tRNA dimethylallyltransferase